jgi:uncharacterized membrane protein YphA (DoxX/SURF4 family)
VESIKKVISLLTTLLLSVGFMGVGMVKMIDHGPTLASFAKWGFPSFAVYLVGLFEIVLALAIFYKPSRKFAAIIAILHMIIAFSIHIVFQEPEQFYGPILVLTLSFFLLFAESKLLS